MRLILILTNKCNLRCITCLRGYAQDSELSLKLIKKLIDDSKRLGIDHISFTGGEPCMHSNFKEIIEYTVYSKLSFNIVTNGTLINDYEFIFKNYKDLNITFNFSLDGASKKIHEEVRRGGNFKKTIQAIRFSVDNKIRTDLIFCINKKISKILKIFFLYLKN